MMKSIDATLKDFIEHGLVTAMEVYLTKVLPLFPEDEIDNFFNGAYQEFLTDVSNDMAEDLLRILPFTPQTASAYIDQVFRGNWTEKKVNRFQDEAIAALGDQAKVAFAQALAVIDTEIAQKVWDLHGPFQISIQRDPSGFELDGTVFIPYKYEKIRDTSGHQLRKWISLIQKSGAVGFFELQNDGTSLFFDRRSNMAESEKKIKLSLDDLPKMVNGRVESPELMLNFQQLAQGPYPRAFTRVPCLLPLDTAAFFESARVFKPQQLFGLKNYDDKTISYHAFNEIPSSDKECFSTDFVCKLVADEEGKECLHDDVVRLTHLLQRVYAFGFKYPDNAVLCMIDTEELASMPIGSVDLDKVASFDQMSEVYCDAFLLGDLYNSGAWDKDNPLYSFLRSGRGSTGTLNQYTSTREVLDVASSQPELLDNIKKQFGDKLFLSICDNEKLSTNTLLTLYKNYGFNNAHFKIRINNRIIRTLKEQGYQFAPNSVMITGICDAAREVVVDQTLTRDQQVDLIQMGLWPGKADSRPDSLEEALKAHVRRPDEQILQASLLAAGIEAVADIAKSDPQWRAIQRLFSDEDMHRVMHLMPKKLKRDRLERDFEL